MWPFKRRTAQVYVPPPRSPGAPEALEALSHVPGPSPWYLQRPGTAVPFTGGELRWHSAGDTPTTAGKSLLRTRNGKTVAVADFHCYVQPLPSNRLLVWYGSETSEGATESAAIHFRIFDCDQLPPLRDLSAAFARLGKQVRFYAEAGEVASVALSTALEDGSHHVTLPDALRDTGELLVLAHSTANGRRENDYDAMHLRLWVLDTGRGSLEIIPQDWFNHGPYDFGYQWVTRMARIPATDDIVGEGIRLGVFRLDASRRHVAEWLVEDIFYHPER